MRAVIAILTYNQLAETRPCLASIKASAPDVDWIVIDNGSTETVLDLDYKGYIEKFIRPPHLIYHKNPENVGVVKGMQQAYELAKDYDIIAYLHNDVYIYEYNWHERVISYFKDESLNIGLASFFGAKGTAQGGARFDSTCNMLEAEVHCGGFRQSEPYVPIAICDGFSMICRREMLEKSGGIDQDFIIHHQYDKALSLQSLRAGYNNIAVNVSCHHISGITACRPGYQEWANMVVEGRGDKSGDTYLHDSNTDILNHKYGQYFPLYVESDFSFRGAPFKGDAIRNG